MIDENPYSAPQEKQPDPPDLDRPYKAHYYICLIALAIFLLLGALQLALIAFETIRNPRFYGLYMVALINATWLGAVGWLFGRVLRRIRK